MVYAEQQAITLPLSGSDGTYWVALSRDVSTAYATWTRRAGSQYLWQLAGARPPDVDGLLVFASVTVAGGVITAVTPAPGVTRAERWRTLAGLGTMAQQNADAVAITGGTATGLTNLTSSGTTLTGFFQSDGMTVPNRGGDNVAAVSSAVAAAGGANRWAFLSTGDAPSQLAGALQVPRLGLNRVPGPGPLEIRYLRATQNGLVLVPDADTGGSAVLFLNAALGAVGTITTTGSATAYNTSSDVRLKEFVQTLIGALDVVRALRPVSFHWQADGSKGNGFLAHELMQIVPEAVSGEPDAVNEDGSIKPQGVDHSRLVPWLTAALQETLAALDALTARVTALEEALGV